MNHLEKKMRYSNAFSSLNSLRNKLEFDGSTVLDSGEKDIILDAIEIAIDRTEESFKKALIYGFHNTGDTVRASALELAKVINAGILKNYIQENDMINLRKILNNDTLSESRETLLNKIDNLMILLNKAKKEEVPSSNMLLIKSFNLL